MFRSLVVVALATLTYASVIPSECFNENTSHSITKREQKQGWMFNSEPIAIGPTVEASMAPNLQSRMCEFQDDEEHLRDYFVTMDDVQACSNPQMESRNAVVEEEVIPVQNFIENPEQENVWVQEQPTNEVPKEFQQEPATFILEEYPEEYLNTRNYEEVIAEPDEDALKIFYTLPENLPNKEVPIFINLKDVPVAKELKENPMFDPSERENSEVVAEAKDMSHVEIAESERVDHFQEAGKPAPRQEAREDAQNEPNVETNVQNEPNVEPNVQNEPNVEVNVHNEPNVESNVQNKPNIEPNVQNEAKEEPQKEDVPRTEEEELDDLKKRIENLKHIKDVQERLEDMLEIIKSQAPKGDNENIKQEDDKESNIGTESTLS